MRVLRTRGSELEADLALGLERADPGPLADPLHGLLWLASNLAEERLLVLIVDDVHWLDQESGRFVAYLARRIESLPVLLLASSRPGQADPLAEVATVITPRPLSAAAVAALIGDKDRAEEV